ncbi:hypothetical protein [Brachybacterium sp. 107]|uniref:hypothetical protein n=1 Tax=Brachybacterium sp. 107 TaxID=3457736 RepID=UPI004033BC7E
MSDPSSSPEVPSSPAPPSDDYSAERRIGRLVAVTLGWWAHGGVRLLLAIALLYYGVAKIVLGQFGVADMGDALVTQGEMSPMGMLWRMVAFSPLFQVLGGVAEAGAALALLWRRSVPLGALIAAADMSLVLVLNIGYDVPVKLIATILLVMSILVLIPWMPRLARAFIDQGEIRRGPLPTLMPWPPLARIMSILGPIAALVLVGLVGWGVSSMYPERTTDESAPAGVWEVQEDAAEPAAQLSEDTRWSAIAFGEVAYDGRAAVQLRLADGELLTGSYERTGEDTVELSLRPLRAQGQTLAQYTEITPTTLALEVAEQDDGTLHVSGEGQELLLAPDTSGSVYYERGFSWGVRADDPFNR